MPATRRPGNGKHIRIVDAYENNLQHITVDIPLGEMTVVTGISGSGKSSLVNEILYKRLAAELNGAKHRPGKHKAMEGLEYVDKVIGIDQSPIGRTPRSNPATYTGVFNDIRTVFAQTQDAKMRGYGAGRFSFNVKGGRCEACEGNGILEIAMHFLPNIYVPCEVCKGARYNRETLEVHYKDKSISDVLNMTVEEATTFFANIPKIHRKLQTLCDVGLGYVQLGQSATTLSGGEAQRVKLALELAKRSTGQTVYILDEPTTGLHVADVHRLVEVLDKLVDAGNTVVVIEHNLDVIKRADHIIDLGPEGGSAGGQIVAEGTPEEIVPARVFTGNRPTTSIFGVALTPFALGELIALYEHITFVEGTVWGLDSYDQWGVELGKQLAKQITPAISQDDEALAAQDASTQSLIQFYRANRKF